MVIYVHKVVASIPKCNLDGAFRLDKWIWYPTLGPCNPLGCYLVHHKLIPTWALFTISWDQLVQAPLTSPSPPPHPNQRHSHALALTSWICQNTCSCSEAEQVNRVGHAQDFESGFERRWLGGSKSWVGSNAMGASIPTCCASPPNLVVTRPCDFESVFRHDIGNTPNGTILAAKRQEGDTNM